MSTYKRRIIDPYLSPRTKFKYKWVQDLNINLIILNLIEKKVGSSLQSQTLRAIINKWNLLYLRNFKQRIQSIRQKDSLLNGKRFSPTLQPDKGLISKIYKELKKLDTKVPNNPIKK